MSWQHLEHQASNSVEQPDPHSETSQHIISGSQTTSKIFWYLCKARISPISWIPTGFFMVFPMVPSNATVYDHIPKQHCLLVYQYIIYLTISPHLTISYDITIKKIDFNHFWNVHISTSKSHPEITMKSSKDFCRSSTAGHGSPDLAKSWTVVRVHGDVVVVWSSKMRGIQTLYIYILYIYTIIYCIFLKNHMTIWQWIDPMLPLIL